MASIIGIDITAHESNVRIEYTESVPYDYTQFK